VEHDERPRRVRSEEARVVRRGADVGVVGDDDRQVEKP